MQKTHRNQSKPPPDRTSDLSSLFVLLFLIQRKTIQGLYFLLSTRKTTAHHLLLFLLSFFLPPTSLCHLCSFSPKSFSPLFHSFGWLFIAQFEELSWLPATRQRGAVMCGRRSSMGVLCSWRRATMPAGAETVRWFGAARCLPKGLEPTYDMCAWTWSTGTHQAGDKDDRLVPISLKGKASCEEQ